MNCVDNVGSGLHWPLPLVGGRGERIHSSMQRQRTPYLQSCFTNYIHVLCFVFSGILTFFPRQIIPLQCVLTVDIQSPLFSSASEHVSRPGACSGRPPLTSEVTKHVPTCGDCGHRSPCRYLQCLHRIDIYIKCMLAIDIYFYWIWICYVPDEHLRISTSTGYLHSCYGDNIYRQIRIDIYGGWISTVFAGKISTAQYYAESVQFCSRAPVLLAGSRGAARHWSLHPAYQPQYSPHLDTPQHTRKTDPILTAADNHGDPSNGNPICMSVTGMSVRHAQQCAVCSVYLSQTREKTIPGITARIYRVFRKYGESFKEEMGEPIFDLCRN